MFYHKTETGRTLLTPDFIEVAPMAHRGERVVIFNQPDRESANKYFLDYKRTKLEALLVNY